MEINDKKFWIFLIFLTICGIFLIIGAILGRLSVEPGCVKDPLIYGINQLNYQLEDEFQCYCTSLKNYNFYVNSSGISYKKVILPLG